MLEVRWGLSKRGAGKMTFPSGSLICVAVSSARDEGERGDLAFGVAEVCYQPTGFWWAHHIAPHKATEPQTMVAYFSNTQRTRTEILSSAEATRESSTGTRLPLWHGYVERLSAEHR